ncbi:MAG: trypsin-like serine protease [Clostridiales bacterium]|nr:trypsin-like serine protease [Clostridiales bacterium]
MDNFYEFDESAYQRKSGVWKYTIIAIVFLLIGAIGMYYIAPTFYKPEINITGNDFDKSEEPMKENDPNESQPVTLPSLGAKGDLFIKSDNPVVEISEKVGPAIVGITNRITVEQIDPFWGTTTKDREGYGSGIVISEDGYIVTNNHVIEDASELAVVLKGGKEVEATLIGKDTATDVAVIKIDESNLTVAKLGDSDQVRQGELAIAIGNPLGHTLAGTVTVGVVSAVDRHINFGQYTYTMIQTDAAINPGNSGGALVNSEGEIIGMNTLKTAAEGLGFAIPTNVFMPIVEQLIEKGIVERPGLGIQIQEVTDEIAKDYGFPKGVAIVKIFSGGAADKAGLIPRDIIIGVEDIKVETIDQLKDEINKFQVGDLVRFTVWRDGKEFVAPVKLQQLQD